MMRNILIGLAVILVITAFRVTEPPLTSDYPVAQLLEVFGDTPMPHKPNTNLARVSVERGRDIVINGFSNVGKKKSKTQSKHFTCIACHNVEREDPDLANPEPEARLSYAKEHDLPFLQGSPLYGIVNRSSFYNGDYVKKYGDLVDLTRHDLREAIALCATECSQGRPLKKWEMESVLAYLWTIELKLGDLNISDDELKLIEQTFKSGNNRDEAIKLIKSKFLDYSPATFVDPPENREEGYQLEGNAGNGQLIYELSCQHCHLDHPFSYLTLDNDVLTFKHLLHKAGTYNPHSIYQVVRYGTSPNGGDEAYMPLYPKEKMTNQQMADLRAYIEVMAGMASGSR